MGDALKNFIFFPSEYDKYIPVLECNDFLTEANYAIIGIKADMASNFSTVKPETAFERIIYSFKKHWDGFKVDNSKCSDLLSTEIFHRCFMINLR